jgi:ParB family chromosome partitioning protein
MTTPPAFSNTDTVTAQSRELSPREKARAEGRRKAEEERQKLLAEAAAEVAKGAAPKGPVVRQGRERDLVDGKAEYKLVPIHDIQRDPDQPRRVFRNIEQLAINIKTRGLKQPVHVRPNPDGPGLILLYGERRWRACKKAGITHIPAIIQYGVDPDEILADQLTENLHREDMDHIEEAHAIRNYMRKNRIGSYTEAAQKLGISLSTVTNKIALLDLDESDQDRVSSGELTLLAGVAKARAKTGKTRKTSNGVTRVLPHFTDDHRLAGRARSRCHAAAKSKTPHGPKVGGVACGACWEVVIRLDAQVNPDVHAGDHV